MDTPSAPTIETQPPTQPGDPMQWVKIIGFILVLCTIWFYFGTPCDKNVSDQSALKRIGCATADTAAKFGELAPEIVHTILAYMIISGVVGGLGTIATIVVGFAKLKKKWSKEPPTGVIADALTTIKKDVSKEKVILEKRGKTAEALRREQQERTIDDIESKEDGEGEGKEEGGEGEGGRKFKPEEEGSTGGLTVVEG